MKTKFILLVITSLFAVSCATTEREPSSVEKKKDQQHKQFEGYFDRPIQ